MKELLLELQPLIYQGLVIATLEYENAVWQVKYTQAINELELLKKEKNDGRKEG